MILIPLQHQHFTAEFSDYIDERQCWVDNNVARTLFELGIAESDVLMQCHRGLLSDQSVVASVEAGWVVRRLAELLDWECPESIGIAPRP